MGTCLFSIGSGYSSYMDGARLLGGKWPEAALGHIHVESSFSYLRSLCSTRLQTCGFTAILNRPERCLSVFTLYLKLEGAGPKMVFSWKMGEHRCSSVAQKSLFLYERSCAWCLHSVPCTVLSTLNCYLMAQISSKVDNDFLVLKNVLQWLERWLNS